MNYNRVDEFIFGKKEYFTIEEIDKQDFSNEEQRHFYKFVDPTNIAKLRYSLSIHSETEYNIIKKLWGIRNIYLLNNTGMLWRIIRQYTVNYDFWERNFVEELYNRYCDLVYYENQLDVSIFNASILNNSKFLFYNFDFIINAWNTKHIMREIWAKNIKYLEYMLYNFINISHDFSEQANKIIAYLISAHDKEQISNICVKYLITVFRNQCKSIADIPYEFVNCEDRICNKIRSRFEFRIFLKFYLKHWDDETAIKYIKKCKNKNIRSYLTIAEIYDYLLNEVEFNDNLKSFVRGQYVMSSL